MAPWSLDALSLVVGGVAAVATFPGVAGNVARVAGDTIANAGV